MSGLEPALTLEEAIKRFRCGGYWRPRQIAKILGWSLSMTYWHISMEHIHAERYSCNSLRVRGEAVADFLESLQAKQAAG